MQNLERAEQLILLCHEQDNIQNKLSNHVWQEINSLHTADCDGHAATAKTI